MLFLSCHFAGENHLSFCDLTEYGRLPAKRRVRTDGRRVGLRSWNCPVVVRRKGRRGGEKPSPYPLLAGVASRAVPLFTCGLGHASGLLEFAREIDVEEGQGLGPGIDDARLQLFGDHEVELPEVAGAGLFEKGQAGRFVDGDERFDESRFRLLERRHERFGGH